MIFSELRERFNVTTIPKLIIINSNGDVLTTRGRKEVTDRGIGAFRSWSSGSHLHTVASTDINKYTEGTEPIANSKSKNSTDNLM